MTRQEELAGGDWTQPLALGAWTQTTDEIIIGFILAEDGDATGLTYIDNYTPNATIAYVGCTAGHYYHLVRPVSAITFTVAATAVFSSQI